MEHLDSHWTDFHEVWYLSIEYLLRKFKFYLNLTRRTRTWCENTCTCMKTTLWILLIMRNILDRISRGNENTNFISNVFSPKKLCHLRDNKHKMYRYVTTALMVTRAHNNVTFYAHCYLFRLSPLYEWFRIVSRKTHMHDVISSFPVDFTPPNRRQTVYSVAKLFCEPRHIQLARS
jgi:hypothetical protein